MTGEDKNWYKLDNAAKLYPAIKRRRWTAVFRLSVKLNDTVDKELLQKALDITLPRMSVFSCRLKAGLFWYYFDKNPKRALVMDDVINPCIKLYRKESGGYLFRLRAHGQRISLEVFHSLSDGYGGIIFLNTLLAEYLKLQGHDIPAKDGVLDCNESVLEEETEDSFLTNYNKKATRSWKENKAYQISGTKTRGHSLSIITGLLSANEVKELAKSYNVSFTEFLAGVYLYCLYTIQKKQNPKKKLPVIVSVPVNLRQFFGSKTLRNFSSYVNPELNANWGDYSFEEVLHIVHHTLRSELTKKTLTAKLSKNVKAEKSIFVRMMPLFLKNFAISFIYSLAGEKRMTSTISNVGRIQVPKEMNPFIDRFDVMLGPLRLNKISCGICAYEDILSITFTSTMQETNVEKEFFTFLVKKGVHVKIETNRE
jgi:NRPS condensation-like uncharacterized protein